MWEELRRYWDIAKASWEDEQREGPSLKRTRDEREFLAAAIELTETPASPAGRIAVWVIVGFFTLAVLWACIGKIDIHATLIGKVVPAGRVKVIEPLEAGTVRRVLVAEGQSVEAGELLVEFDATDSTVDRKRLRRDLATARLESLRLKATLTAVREGLEPTAVHIEAPSEAEPDDVSLQSEVLLRTLAAHRASINSIDAQITQRRAEHERYENSVIERKQLVAVLAERTEMFQTLSRNKTGSRVGYLNSAQIMYDERANLATDQGQLREAEAAVAALESQKQEMIAEFMSKAVTELAEVEKRIPEYEQEYLKATQRDEHNQLYAPVRGVVRQMMLHTIGEVVTTGEKLMTIVPAESTLEVEAELINRDKGFVAAGQTAEIKIDAFPFTKYGVIEGKVIDVSNDSVETKDRGFIFPVRVEMERASVVADGQELQLTPGMSVQVEVRTGDRRVIEYLLTPLLRYKEEAIRER